jgi:hypothetical protein
MVDSLIFREYRYPKISADHLDVPQIVQCTMDDEDGSLRLDGTGAERE